MSKKEKKHTIGRAEKLAERWGMPKTPVSEKFRFWAGFKHPLTIINYGSFKFIPPRELHKRICKKYCNLSNENTIKIKDKWFKGKHTSYNRGVRTFHIHPYDFNFSSDSFSVDVPDYNFNLYNSFESMHSKNESSWNREGPWIWHTHMLLSKLEDDILNTHTRTQADIDIDKLEEEFMTPDILSELDKYFLEEKEE